MDESFILDCENLSSKSLSAAPQTFALRALLLMLEVSLRARSFIFRIRGDNPALPHKDGVSEELLLLSGHNNNDTCLNNTPIVTTKTASQQLCKCCSVRSDLELI